MPRALPYRRASGEPAWSGKSFTPRRRSLLIVLFLAILIVTWLVAGDHAPDVFRTWIYAILILPIIAAAWMLGIALTEPFARRGLFAPTDPGWPELFRSIVAEALGLGAFALGMLLLGTLGLISPQGQNWVPAILVLLAAGIGFLPAQKFLRNFSRAPLVAKVSREEWLILLAAVPIAILLIAATYPPGTLWAGEGRAYDVLEYHLQLPREYAANNSTAPLAHNVYSFFPANVEMLYLLTMQLARAGMSIGAADTLNSYLWAIYPAQFLHAWMMLLAVLAVATAPIRLQILGRTIAVLVILSVPWTIITGSLAYNEAGMILFGTLALLLALAPQKNASQQNVAQPPSAVFLLIGILLGLAVGCKMTAGIFFALPVALIVLAKSNRKSKIENRKSFKALALIILTAVALYLPWALRAAIYSHGNPLFPVAAATLGHDDWTPDQVTRFALGHVAKESGRIVPLADIKTRAVLLARETLLHDQWSPASSAIDRWAGEHPLVVEGAPGWFAWWPRLGILWMIAPVGIVLALLKTLRQPHPAGADSETGHAFLLLAVIILQLLAWMFLTHEQSRFLLPMVIPLSILIGMGAEGLGEGVGGLGVGVLRILICTIVALQTLACAFLLLPETDLFHGTVPRDGKPPRDQLIGVIPHHNWAAEIEDPAATINLEPLAKILFLGDAAVFYEQGAEILYNTVFDKNPLVENLHTLGPARTVQWLADQHITYIIIDWPELARLQRTYGLNASASFNTLTPEDAAALIHAGLTPIESKSPNLTILHVVPRP